MSSLQEQFAALGDQIAAIIDTMEQGRRVDVPREPTDASTQGLLEAVNGILAYLRRLNDVQLPPAGAEDDLADMDAALDAAVERLGAMTGGGQATPGGSGGQPGGGPGGGMGMENLRVDLPAATVRYQVLAANQENLADVRFDWAKAH